MILIFISFFSISIVTTHIYVSACVYIHIYTHYSFQHKTLYHFINSMILCFRRDCHLYSTTTLRLKSMNKENWGKKKLKNNHFISHGSSLPIKWSKTISVGTGTLNWVYRELLDTDEKHQNEEHKQWGTFIPNWGIWYWFS